MKKLARNDILALKNADHIMIASPFLWKRENLAKITCAKQVGADFHNWEVSAVSTVVFLHDDLQESNLQCQYFIYNSYMNWHWQTCVGSLVPTDEIELLWLPDVETTPELLGKNVHVDLLKMVVYRQNFRFHYLLGVVAGTTNRMITGLSKPLNVEWLTPKSL
jgi:hypothetical protein